MHDRGFRALVLDCDDTLAGYATLGRSRAARRARPCGEIYELYLRPECQGCGLGRRLFAEARRELGAARARAADGLGAGRERARLPLLPRDGRRRGRALPRTASAACHSTRSASPGADGCAYCSPAGSITPSRAAGRHRVGGEHQRATGRLAARSPRARLIVSSWISVRPPSSAQCTCTRSPAPAPKAASNAARISAARTFSPTRSASEERRHRRGVDRVGHAAACRRNIRPPRRRRGSRCRASAIRAARGSSRCPASPPRELGRGRGVELDRAAAPPTATPGRAPRAPPARRSRPRLSGCGQRPWIDSCVSVTGSPPALSCAALGGAGHGLAEGRLPAQHQQVLGRFLARRRLHRLLRQRRRRRPRLDHVHPAGDVYPAFRSVTGAPGTAIWK